MNLAALYNMPATEITRESYFNVGGMHGFMRWGVYIFMIAAFIYLGITLVRRILIWRQGKGELRTDFHEKRILAFIKYVILQIKILRESYAGIFHVSLFWGFIGLFIVTLILLVQEDLTELFFHTKFIYGNFYLFWSLAGDLFGMVVLAGIIMAVYRRYWLKPSRLDTKPIDTFAIVLIGFIIMTGFFNEAMRIAITDFPKFEVWSPFGYTLAYAFGWIGKPALEAMHYVNWWLHMIAAFSFIGLVGSDKLGHVAITMLNVYFQNLDNESEKTKYAMKVIAPSEFETAESFGVGSVEQFTWKQLMDGDACTRCGRCQDNCPAYLTEKPLSPKKIINDVKAAMDERVPKLMEAKKKGEDPAGVQSKTLIGEPVDLNALPAPREQIPERLALLLGERFDGDGITGEELALLLDDSALLHQRRKEDAAQLDIDSGPIRELPYVQSHVARDRRCDRFPRLRKKRRVEQELTYPHDALLLDEGVDYPLHALLALRQHPREPFKRQAAIEFDDESGDLLR